MLLAELLLQRTRADLVVSIYERLLQRWPTAQSLAGAEPGDVAAVLRPLGFEHRNRRIQAAARACGEGVPRTLDGLLAIPGVGRYAASATLCFAYRRRMAVIDPTVIRILERLELAKSTRSRPREDAAVWEAAQAVMPSKDARTWNYAMLDFGALVCRVRPRCLECPLVSLCPTGQALMRDREPMGYSARQRASFADG